MSVQVPKVTKTIQVDFNGERLTAHFEMFEGQWNFVDFGSNTGRVNVLLATHVTLIMMQELKDQ